MNENKEQAAAFLGLDTASNPAEREYDLTEALLTAADFRDDADNITAVEIRRKGKLLFTVHIHPMSDTDNRIARKRATTYCKDPRGAKYPQIEKDFNTNLFNSWIIYLATTEEDQSKIWGNSAVKQKFGLLQNVESIDILLRAGEKSALISKIVEISGFDEEETISMEDYAKN